MVQKPHLLRPNGKILPSSGTWKGPDPILIWGRGHVCVFSQDENQARWLPERLIRCIQQKDNGPGPGDSLADNRAAEGNRKKSAPEGIQ